MSSCSTGELPKVSNRIRAVREARAMSLEALAERVGATNQQISLLENGKRRLTVDWLQRLAAALKCHPWLLVSDDAPAPLQSLEIRLLEAFRTLELEHRKALVLLATSMTGRQKPDRRRAPARE